MNLLQRDVEQGGYARFVGLKKKYPNLKTTIALGGWGEGGKKYSQMASIPARRQTFVRSVVGMFFKFTLNMTLIWQFESDHTRLEIELLNSYRFFEHLRL
jgi:chitinase